jgi:hypothetical protein
MRGQLKASNDLIQTFKSFSLFLRSFQQQIPQGERKKIVAIYEKFKNNIFLNAINGNKYLLFFAKQFFALLFARANIKTLSIHRSVTIHNRKKSVVYYYIVLLMMVFMLEGSKARLYY